MAETAVNSQITEEQWSSKFFTEYVRQNRFKRYMGTDENSLIIIKNDLTKKAGDGITVPLISALEAAGVSDNEVLEGNEEDLANYGHKIMTHFRRHAVTLSKDEDRKTKIDLLNAARSALKKWFMKNMRGGSDAKHKYGGIIEALGTFGSAFDRTATTSESTKDTWLANNSDRVLFGAAKSNNSSNDHSASLANIDNTNDKLTSSAASLLKRMAQEADPKVHPITVEEDEEHFVVFVGTRTMRDLKADEAIQKANREARERGKNNPLFRGGDLIWDNLIIREIPEIPVLEGVGAGGIDVQPVYLCGAGAVGVAWQQRFKPETEDKDYGFRQGVAGEECLGIEKLYFNDKQHGVVTGYFAAVADS